MKQRAVAIFAEYLSIRPLGRVVAVEPIGDDDYVLAIEDIRDERVHVGRTPLDFEPWLKSVKEDRHIIPAFGPCGLRPRRRKPEPREGSPCEKRMGPATLAKGAGPQWLLPLRP